MGGEGKTCHIDGWPQMLLTHSNFIVKLAGFGNVLKFSYRSLSCSLKIEIEKVRKTMTGTECKDAKHKTYHHVR